MSNQFLASQYEFLKIHLTCPPSPVLSPCPDPAEILPFFLDSFDESQNSDNEAKKRLNVRSMKSSNRKI